MKPQGRWGDSNCILKRVPWVRLLPREGGEHTVRSVHHVCAQPMTGRPNDREARCVTTAVLTHICVPD